MAKFGSLKVGDICKVIGNCNAHGFKDGEEVELYEICDHSEDWFFVERGVPFRAKTLGGISICYNIVREVDLERVDNMKKMKDFTKSDLQVGYVVEITDKENSKTFLMKVENGKEGECLSGEKAWFPIDKLKENMIYKSDFNNYVVTKIYGFATNINAWKVSTNSRELLWERAEKSPMEIKLEELEKQQRTIADEIASLREEI